MAKQLIVVVLCCLIALLVGSTASAQQSDDQQKVFNLVIGEKAEAEEAEEEAVATERHVPAIEAGALDLTLTLGFFYMNENFLELRNTIYRETEEHLYYGDIVLTNETGFNPILRLGYTLTSWFGLEAQTGVTFSEYQGSITAPRRVNPSLETLLVEDATLGEFDAERRSAFTWISNLNALWYPLNMDGDGRGRLHPYLTGGVGYALYNIDSNYTDDAATALDLNAGVGLKFIADRMISLRAELVYHRHDIRFEPAQYFDERDAGTRLTPIYEFDEVGAFSEVTEFAEKTLGGMTLQVGFTARF